MCISPKDGLDGAGGDAAGDGLFPADEVHQDVRPALVEQEGGEGAVRVAVDLAGQSGRAEAARAQAYGAGLQDPGAVGHVVVVRIAHDGAQ